MIVATKVTTSKIKTTTTTSNRGQWTLIYCLGKDFSSRKLDFFSGDRRHRVKKILHTDGCSIATRFNLCNYTCKCRVYKFCLFGPLSCETKKKNHYFSKLSRLRCVFKRPRGGEPLLMVLPQSCKLLQHQQHH